MDFSGRHFPKEVILTCVRWYLRYKLSDRDIEELMAERGVELDHATVHRWGLTYLPQLASEARRHKRPVGVSWRLDETYVRVRGQWKYLDRAVDKAGATVDFLLTAKRYTTAALRFLSRAIRGNGIPKKVHVEKSGANSVGIADYDREAGTGIVARRCNHLNNIVEQNHGAVKQKARAALGFKAFHAAHATLQGFETVQMIRKGQICLVPGGTFVDQFNAMAA